MFPEQIEAIYLHQVNEFDHLSLGSDYNPASTSGPARIYEERAYFLDGTVYIGNQADKSILPWLADVGLSPRELVTVPDKCVFRGLKESPDLLTAVAGKIARGARPHFFRTTTLESEFINALGLSWSDTLSCDPAIAEKIGNKAFLRRFAAELNCADVFPPHVILSSGWRVEDISKATWKLTPELRKIKADKVIVKRTDLAGGDGCCVWNGNGCGDFQTVNAGRELIVEAFIDPRITITGQWLIADGKFHYIGMGKQYQLGFVHQGIIASSSKSSVAVKNLHRMKDMVEPLLTRLVQIGYNGIIGFDAVYHLETDCLYLTEANTRTTADTYVYAVAARLGFRPWAVACKIIKPALGITDFRDVKNSLGYLLYQPARENGIAPYMLSGLKLPSGQRRLGLMSISTNPGTAEHFLREAESRLC